MTYEFKLLSKASPFLHGLISNQKEFEVDRPYVLKEIDKIEEIEEIEIEEIEIEGIEKEEIEC